MRVGLTLALAGLVADGTDVCELTDNQWEEGTPAWVPSPKPPRTATR